MNRDSTRHDALKAAVAAYALDALPDDGIGEVEEHLGSCPECRADLRDFQNINEWLADIAERPLPTGFTDRVIARAAEARRLAPKSVATKGTRATTVALAVALVIAAIIAGTAVSRLQSAQNELTSTRDAVETLVGGDETVELVGDEVQGWIVIDDNQGVLAAEELRTTSEEAVYQLWLERGTRVVSAGTFEPSAEGVTLFDFRLPLGDFDRFLVTLEPTEGSPRPNLDQVVMESR